MMALRSIGLAVVLGAVAAPAGAQNVLSCGMPLSRALAAGATHVYDVSTAAQGAVVIQASDTSGTLGLIRMRVTGPGGTLADTCTGVVRLTMAAAPLELEVSQCSGSSGGQYTVSLNVVSDGPGNCGRPLTCGATPEGTGFAVAGEVDSYLLSLSGEETKLRLNYTRTAGAPSLRLFDPDGQEVQLDSRCTGEIEFEPAQAGVYTALVSACGRPLRQPYRIELADGACPEGPVITTFGVANAAGDPQEPAGSDDQGRPIFRQAFGQGFSLIVETRAGANGRNPGIHPVPYLAGEDEVAPDMEMILSRPLGDGSPVVCDTQPPDLGGVPATVPFAFDTSESGLDILHDMGCRFVDGTGGLVARQASDEACTRSDEGFGFAFVDRASRLQFCGVIATAWRFPAGDTIVAARAKDEAGGEFGAVREIVVRVADSPPGTASPTPSPTPIRTRTPTATPGGVCTGDCAHDGAVTINELTQVVNIVLGQLPPAVCPAGDANGDGAVTIGEVIAAVVSALDGCP